MALEKRSASNTVFLQAKHYCLWQEIKKPVEGCETVEVTNPKTKQTLTKHGFAYNTVTGRVTRLEKYDTGDKYASRFFGFKLHLQDNEGHYVFDMPYNSQALRRFLVAAPNMEWSLPLSITVFKGKKPDGAGAEPTVVWFRQKCETVKAYFTREHPHGMPDAFQDEISKEWDFKAQRRWLVSYLIENVMPAIADAAAVAAPPEEPAREAASEPEPEFDPYGGHGITDDDVPF